MIMKRLFVSLLAVIALCNVANAQKVSVADVEAVPGETVAFALTVDVQGGAYSGFQFEMQFPAEGFATAGTTASPDWGGASFGVGDLVEGKANGSAFSTSDSAIPDGEQEIATVKFTVASTVALGDYDVKISNFNFLDGTNYTPVADVTFKVHVVNAHSVVLDEESTTVPATADGVNVTVKRTLTANEWSTICLPFAMTAEQMKAAFGDDVKVADFTGTDDPELDADKVVGITANFSSVTAIEANHPYIIMVSAPITEFTLDNVNIVPDENEAYIEFDNGKTGRQRMVYSGFYGTYVAETIVPAETLILNESKFSYSDGTATLKAFRGYFEFIDVLDAPETAPEKIVMKIDNEVVTGIRGIISSDNDNYYDLQGRRVQTPGKGVYLQEGRKVVVNKRK